MENYEKCFYYENAIYIAHNTFPFLKGLNYFNDADVWCSQKWTRTTLKINFTVAHSSYRSLLFFSKIHDALHMWLNFSSFFIAQKLIIFYTASVVYQSSKSNLSHTCWINFFLFLCTHITIKVWHDLYIFSPFYISMHIRIVLKWM